MNQTKTKKTKLIIPIVLTILVAGLSVSLMNPSPEITIFCDYKGYLFMDSGIPAHKTLIEQWKSYGWYGEQITVFDYSEDLEYFKIANITEDRIPVWAYGFDDGSKAFKPLKLSMISNIAMNQLTSIPNDPELFLNEEIILTKKHGTYVHGGQFGQGGGTLQQFLDAGCRFG